MRTTSGFAGGVKPNNPIDAEGQPTGRGEGKTSSDPNQRPDAEEVSDFPTFILNRRTTALGTDRANHWFDRPQPGPSKISPRLGGATLQAPITRLTHQK